jgi:hypothetical protein
MTKFEIIYSMILMSLLLFCAYLIFNLPKTIIAVQYDCRLAEISVDYPQQVKEQCRRLMK